MSYAAALTVPSTGGAAHGSSGLSRAAAASRGGYTAAAAPQAWLARLGLAPPPGKDPLALFAKPSLRKDAPRIMCCDARGRELFAARRLEELENQKPPDEAAKACFEKLRRDECTRNLVADGALTVNELVACARRYADKAALGSDPKSLSPRSAGRHTSVVRHVLLADDEIDALLAKQPPPVEVRAVAGEEDGREMAGRRGAGLGALPTPRTGAGRVAKAAQRSSVAGRILPCGVRATLSGQALRCSLCRPAS